MNTEMQFSVVVTTHERPNLILRCIDSIIATNELNLDIIVVDDCSVMLAMTYF